jgi:putative transposase
VTLTRCYKFRLEPTVEQQAKFRQFAGCRRFVWNWALAQRQSAFKNEGVCLSYSELAARLVELKQQPETRFLTECDSQVLQQTLRDLDRAFVNFFEKRANYPKPKSRKRTPHSFRIPQRVTPQANGVSIPKVGIVKARLHRPMEGMVKSATIKQPADGHWQITFVSHFEKEDPTPSSHRPAGIDVGLESFVAFDDGQKIAPPKFYRKSERKLKRLQRYLSRKQKGSRNRAKAKGRLAATSAKVRNKRNNWLHQLALAIISCHDTLCIEDLNLKGLARTKLAKSFSDAAHATFFRMLIYKGLWCDCQVVKVGRFFASSKRCSCCGHQQALTLADRWWRCASCGTQHDRDVNAARNLLEEGLRLLAQGHGERLNARGEAVRLAKASVPH